MISFPRGRDKNLFIRVFEIVDFLENMTALQIYAAANLDFAIYPSRSSRLSK